MANVFRWPADEPLPGDFLSELGRLLHAGNAVVYPTSTLYGLGASIHSEEGIKLVNRIKGRPGGMPLTIMATMEQLEKLCAVTAMARPFLGAGDSRITAVLPALDSAPEGPVHNGTLAVRLPCSRLTASLVEAAGPVTATSANIHGAHVPADIPGAVEQLGDGVSIYIDSGRLTGAPTTLVDLTGERPKIIREGAISAEEVGKIHERGNQG